MSSKHLWLAVGLLTLPAAAPAAPPQISHDPVSMAVRGQPLSILAQAHATSGTIKSVTLLYTLSKDAAPFKLPMQAAGTQTYMGTIPAGLISNADKLWYYLEVTDSLDASTETPWFVVTISDARQLASASGGGAAPAPGPERDTGRSSLVGAGLVAGGAAAVVGAALLVAHRGGGSDSGTAATNAPGRYAGSKTICLTMSGASQQCVSTPATIVIDQQGAINSDSLLDGQLLSGQLSGGSFTLTGSTSVSNLVSQLQFSGSLVGQRLVGSITGTAQSATNQGAYSGAFTADKQ